MKPTRSLLLVIQARVIADVVGQYRSAHGRRKHHVLLITGALQAGVASRKHVIARITEDPGQYINVLVQVKGKAHPRPKNFIRLSCWADKTSLKSSSSRISLWMSPL